jgi:hypothetical protein
VLASLALRISGVEFGEMELQTTIMAIVEAIGGIAALYGRIAATKQIRF